ncbi:MAG: arsenosugar biosynthesis radical SAM protein ArsS [Gemmatimonadota bacterium]|nr:arsenosugar biosynthesis radical SAM protein ArsS [Gemmatimonadota bacterium]
MGAPSELLAIHTRIQGEPDIGPVSFGTRLRREGVVLRRDALETLQINVGKLCNQACRHCHVDAGPNRTEVMTRETMQSILTFLAATDIPMVDITGGAPEVNPDFRFLVKQVRRLGRSVMVRCNLTVIFEPGLEDLPDFYREHEVELVCSLPCYLEENVDQQRGKGVFFDSIEALKRLNEIGYGEPDSGLLLHLVYNPIGASLPPPQAELEADYKRVLDERYGISFNRLFTITNMPISRFNDYLRRRGEYDGYTRTLRDRFNAQTIDRLMCRFLVSVDWEGNIYDCDFNQMLDMHLSGRPKKLWEVSPGWLVDRRIRIADHCYGCTAGAGSSCGGELA